MQKTVGELREWISHFEDGEKIDLVSDQDGESACIRVCRAGPDWKMWDFSLAEVDDPPPLAERQGLHRREGHSRTI